MSHRHTPEADIDPRIAFSPLIKYLYHALPILFSNNNDPTNYKDNKITPVFVFVVALLLLLSIQFKIPITISLNRQPIITIRFRDIGFPGLLEVSLITAFLIWPWHLLGIYFVCMLIHPWAKTLVEAVKSRFHASTSINDEQAVSVAVDDVELQVQLGVEADGDSNF